MSRDLCTLADVTQLVPGYVSDAETDTLLAALITSESRTAHQATGREFIAVAGLDPRSFDVTARDVRARIVAIGDASTITTVTIKDQQDTTVETVTSANYVGLPRNREEWQPIEELWFPKGSASAAPLADGYVLEVAATWGFPSVPSDVITAVAKLVLVRYIGDAASSGTALSDALNEQTFDAASAFASAQDVLASYRPATFA